MSTKSSVISAIRSDERWLYQIGGVCALAIAVLYVVIVGLYARGGALPTGGEGWMQYLQGKTSTWSAIVGLSVLTNFLYVPVAISLYFALKSLHKTRC